MSSEVGIILYTILTLSLLGSIAAAILYFVSEQFKVVENPKIEEVAELLPGVNCGGCGYAGCHAFAVELVTKEDISSLNCPVGGGEIMSQVAKSLGKKIAEREAETATLRCGGCKAKRADVNIYDGAKSCEVAASLYGGSTACAYGCYGYGDCAISCSFGAIAIDQESGLPVIDAEKCTACGQCVARCPKGIIELRKRQPKNRAVYVACSSKEKGAVVMKACKAGCIGCGKCLKVCAFDAITVSDNLSYIDSTKCKLCRKCLAECPTGAIQSAGFESTTNKAAKEVKAAPTKEEKAAPTKEEKAAPAKEEKAATAKKSPAKKAAPAKEDMQTSLDLTTDTPEDAPSKSPTKRVVKKRATKEEVTTEDEKEATTTKKATKE